MSRGAFAFAGACGGDHGGDTGRGRVGCARRVGRVPGSGRSRGSAISMGAGEERVARWETLLEVVQVAMLAGLSEGCEELLRELVLGR